MALRRAAASEDRPLRGATPRKPTRTPACRAAQRRRPRVNARRLIESIPGDPWPGKDPGLRRVESRGTPRGATHRVARQPPGMTSVRGGRCAAQHPPRPSQAARLGPFWKARVPETEPTFGVLWDATPRKTDPDSRALRRATPQPRGRSESNDRVHPGRNVSSGIESNSRMARRDTKAPSRRPGANRVRLGRPESSKTRPGLRLIATPVIPRIPPLNRRNTPWIDLEVVVMRRATPRSPIAPARDNGFVLEDH